MSSDEDYHAIYNHYRQRGYKEEDVYIIISGTAVQFLPNIDELSNESINKSLRIRVNGVPGKIIRIEHLITLLLKTYRPRDRISVDDLIRRADLRSVNKTVERFDDGQRTLSKRLKEILGRA